MMNAVRAHEITALLDDLDDDVRILSLDCFDTLIWRNAHAPIDVFHDLDIPGGAMPMRVLAENRARKALVLDKQRSEVAIDEIYAHLKKGASEEEIARHVDAELKAEMRHCYAFRPVVDLIAAAKERGLSVIIVSDTYLREPQLRALITAAAGEETAKRIDRIFCSCEYGEGKAAGLFRHVLADLGASPGTILHIGDNKLADFDSPIKLGIRSVHFEQFDAEAGERLRLEAAVATMLDRDIRGTCPALQPQRAQISLRQADHPVERFGHDVLGPIMHGFASWIASEADEIAQQTGKTPKLLFLLRDGFLPAEAFKAAFPDRRHEALTPEISRFTATAASFTDRQAIEDYLIAEATNNRKDAYSQSRQGAFCRQMLFSAKEVGKLSRASSPRNFIRDVMKPVNSDKILARSKQFSESMFAHLRGLGVQDGDAVMIVDLGYNGSVQNAIEPLLRDRMKLTVHGRYLLLRERTLTDFDKKGMIDLRNYDFNAVNALCESISLMEQFATIGQGSVVGYEQDGTPIRVDPDIKGQQNEIRDAAQAACLDYMRGLDSAWTNAPASLDGQCARQMAAACLTRLLFLPVESEVRIFENLVHDVNMGTADMVKFVDSAAGARSLRRQGIGYTSNTLRMYLPGELKQQGLSALLSMFASRRFGLDLKQNDFHGASLTLPVILMDQNQHVQIEVDARPTADGYYQAFVPVGAGQFSAGLMIGKLCDWVQVDQATFHPVEGFTDHKIDDDSIVAEPMFESMSEQAPGLLQCDGDEAFVLFAPPPAGHGGAMMLNFVFRPIIMRGEETEAVRQVA